MRVYVEKAGLVQRRQPSLLVFLILWVTLKLRGYT
jgi:hypothetical protein